MVFLGVQSASFMQPFNNQIHSRKAVLADFYTNEIVFIRK